MKKHIILHPFLLALAPIFALLYANIEETSFIETVVPSIVSVTATFIIYFGLKFALKSPVKAGLMTSLTVFLFFLYGRAYAPISNIELLGISLGRHRYVLPLLIAILLVSLRWLHRTDKELSEVSRVLNGFAASWLVIVLVQIGYADLNQHIAKLQVINMVSPEKDDSALRTNSHKQGYKPDIYYLIFDSYSGAPALKEFLDFDNSDFTDYLENTGFYVASDSRSNYTISQQSIASSLSFMYHDGMKSNAVFYEMLQDYRVWRFLTSQGYSFYHFGSWWATIRENRFADYNFPYEDIVMRSPSANRYLVGDEQSSFTSLLLGTTVFDAVPDYYDPDTKTDKYTGLREALLEKFDELGKIPHEERPKFVFAHMLIPHGPYLFNERGEPLGQVEAEKISDEENYVNYIKFANKRIERLVEEIISNSENPPIIILQADEGFTPWRRFNEEENSKIQSRWYGRNADDLKLHLSILNAYYLPGFDKSKLYKSVSPVNSFRLIFNHYFGTRYPLLEDETFLDDPKLNKWTNITDKAK